MVEPWIWIIACLAFALIFGILEILLPSGGLLFCMALICLVGSVVFAFQSSFLVGVVYMLATLLGVPLALWAFFQWWPRSQMGKKILADPEDDPALQPDELFLTLKELVGKRGVARSKMMLSGLIEVDGKRINAMSETDVLMPGDEVIVVRVDGVHVLVRPWVSLSNTSKIAEEPAVVEDPFL